MLKNKCPKDKYVKVLQNGNVKLWNRYRRFLEYNNVYTIDLNRVNLDGAFLNGVSLNKASLNKASLDEASLIGASLDEASLNGSSLDKASLINAKYQITNLLYSINWGELSDELTLELMRHDAEIIGIDKMNEWSDGGKCPYDNMYRDFKFAIKEKLWKAGKPKLRGLKLFKALCKEKNIKISL